jgi:hypothetical protein
MVSAADVFEGGPIRPEDIHRAAYYRTTWSFSLSLSLCTFLLNVNRLAFLFECIYMCVWADADAAATNVVTQHVVRREHASDSVQPVFAPPKDESDLIGTPNPATSVLGAATPFKVRGAPRSIFGMLVLER